MDSIEFSGLKWSQRHCSTVFNMSDHEEINEDAKSVASGDVRSENGVEKDIKDEENVTASPESDEDKADINNDKQAEVNADNSEHSNEEPSEKEPEAIPAETGNESLDEGNHSINPEEATSNEPADASESVEASSKAEEREEFHDTQGSETVQVKDETEEDEDKDSVSDASLLKNKQDDLEQKIESFSEKPEPPKLPPRTHIASGSVSPPQLPPRSHVANSMSGPIHTVPPPLTEEMKSPEFRTHFNKHKRSDSSDFDLILNRFIQNETELELRDEKERENAKKGTETLIEEYDELVDHTEKELVDIDWPFWSKLVHSFSEVVKEDSKKLESEVGKGIPPQIRGIVWQLLTSSNYKEMEDFYNSLLAIESPHEKGIRRDLSRTNFIPEGKSDSLFNVLKAYSLYDPPVGYTQGMAFIATTLILNCDEEWQAFSLLTKLMKVYGFRSLFLPGMPGLMLKLYQFDTLLEEHDPQLYNHLLRQGIRSTMFATQWFLTMFAYKFPLDFVLRIMDIVILEGIESILKFSLNLMIKNSRNLIVLTFDSLLDFLKEDLFQYYASEENPEGYDIDKFISDSLEIKITPLQLERYCKEFEEIHKLETEKEQRYEEQRIKNRELQKELKRLEHDYALVNKEHVAIANELIENRLRMETLQDENRDLQQEIQDLQKQLEREIYKQTLPNPDAEIPTDLKEDLNKTMERNLQVMTENQELRERLDQLEKENYELRTGKTWTKEATSPRGSRLGSWAFKTPWK
ncbi:GTPase-activating protein GYP5 [Kluyveromyces marxianus]|nr:GTPase-activating protein GYP5 [Kluyveromyces marxianus]